VVRCQLRLSLCHAEQKPTHLRRRRAASCRQCVGKAARADGEARDTQRKQQREQCFRNCAHEIGRNQLEAWQRIV
jgi:hypothetical protein